MFSRKPKADADDAHYINIQDNTPSTSTLSKPSSTSSSSSSPPTKRPARRKDVANNLDQSVLQSLLKTKEDRSLYKDETVKESVSSGRRDPKLTFARLLAQARPERSLLIAATVCLFISALLNLMIPAFCGTIIDAISYDDVERTKEADWLYSAVVRLGFGDSPRAILNVSVIILVIVVVVASLFSTLRGYWFTLAGERVVARLRINLFTHLSNQEVGFFDVTRTGELINRLSTDTTVLKDAVTVNISMALRWIANIVVGIGYLFFRQLEAHSGDACPSCRSSQSAPLSTARKSSYYQRQHRRRSHTLRRRPRSPSVTFAPSSRSTVRAARQHSTLTRYRPRSCWGRGSLGCTGCSLASSHWWPWAL